MTLVIDTYKALRDPDYRFDLIEQLEGGISELLYEAAADEIKRLQGLLNARRTSFIAHTQWDDSPLPTEFSEVFGLHSMEE